jgi:PAS domain-containing protein
MENKPVIKEDREAAEHFIKTFSDTAREPFLILDLDLRVIGANASFYRNFRVCREETENKLVYDLGNGQWDIPELRRLLETILPNKRVFNDFEVAHEFPDIGPKIMLLNARQLDPTRLILLAIEDVTAKMAVETRLANYAKELEGAVAGRTAELGIRIDELTKINGYMNSSVVGRELKMVELKREITKLRG